MKATCTTILVLFCISLFAQEPVPNSTSGKGVTPIPNSSIPNTQSTTRAVVIGISDYLNEDIPDLNFAHKDAEAFVTYLKSPAGGSLPDANIMLLTNKNATTGQMYAALDWLIDESQPGDSAIIYFSGHGDVETVTRRQRGFLLTYDSPPNNYRAGAYAIVFLQDVIETLSLDKETYVVMISDACRAGKLAGSNVNGTQATSASLAQQFANEVKILSCQPEEFSLEGEQWGGGRGCFSYHLLDGLYGLADQNNDNKVNLLELERYLEDKVVAEAAPHSQIPMTVGSKASIVANVDRDYLQTIIAEKKGQQTVLAGIDSKGMEDLVLENADTNIQLLYQEFLAAIENGNLMEPEGRSANDYYEILRKEESIKKLHGFMRRNFAAALMDDSQVALHDYFYNTDKYYSEYFQTKEKSLKNFSKHLKKAAKLLGENHYMYNSLKAKEWYFYSINLKENKNISEDSLIGLRINALNKALEFDSESAFIYKELGDRYGTWDTLKTMHNYEKAIELSPDWPVLYVDYGMFYRDIANYDKAADCLKKAIEKDSTFIAAYRFLGWFSSKENYRKITVPKTISIIEKMIEEEEAVFPYYYLILGEAYWMLAGNFNDYSGIENGRAEEVMKTAIDKMGDNVLRSHTLLGEIYSYSNKYEEAIKEYQYVMNHPNSYQRLKYEATAYLSYLYRDHLKDYKKAEQLYLKLFEYIDPNDIHFMSLNYFDLGNIYYKLDDAKKAIKNYKKAIGLSLNDGELYYHLAIAYVKSDDTEKAIENYKKAIELNPKTIDYKLELLNYLLDLNRNNEAEEIIENVVVEELNSIDDYYNLCAAYLKLKDMEVVEVIIQKGLEKFPDDNVHFYNNARLYSLANNKEKAIKNLEISFQKGFKNYENLQKDTDLDNIRNTPEFEALMKKYFPDQHKD